MRALIQRVPLLTAGARVVLEPGGESPLDLYDSQGNSDYIGEYEGSVEVLDSNGDSATIRVAVSGLNTGYAMEGTTLVRICQ